MRVDQFHTVPSYIYPLRITSRNIHFQKPSKKAASHITITHHPSTHLFPAAAAAVGMKQGRPPRLNRMSKSPSSANALPGLRDEHQLHIGRQLAGDQHPMMVLKKTPQQLCLPRRRPSTCWVDHLRFVEPTRAPTGGCRQGSAKQAGPRTTAGQEASISPTTSHIS